MLSRGYLQSGLVAVVLLVFASGVTVNCEEGENVVTELVPNFGGNGTEEEVRKESEGSLSDADESHGQNVTEITATPALSTSTVEASSTSTTTSSESSAERSTVTITPSTASLPTMIITATKVTLGHRMLGPEEPAPSAPAPADEEVVENDEGVTEMPVEEEATTNIPFVADYSSPEKFTTPPTAETAPPPVYNHRKARYHRIHENAMTEVEEAVTEPSFVAHESARSHETSTEYYREMEVDGGDSYGDFGEDNELPEQLPTPMALINTNGEGNNPPLEDDFAEAFKKVNSNGRRRRLRGGRRGRVKVKKGNNNNTVAQTTGADAIPVSGPADSSQDQTLAASRPSGSSAATEDGGVYYGGGSSLQTTAVAGPSSTKRPKIYRSTTTSSSIPGRLPAASSTSSSETTSVGSGGTTTVVKNGPKPLILQDINSANTDTNSITQSPQIERPGNGGHTEKISTYFFSTPSPSNRLRLRQKIRDSIPSSTTELPPRISSYAPPPVEQWKNPDYDFNQNPFFKNSPAKLHIPAFVPMDLGLESDRQDPIESALSRPDPPALENKAYSIHHSPDSVSHATYESYASSSSTTPKSRRIKGPPTSSSYMKIGYDTSAHTAPSLEMEKGVGTEYYSRGAGGNSEASASTTYSTAHRSPPAGSHYDRTKDRVIFYSDNSPYGSITQSNAESSLASLQHHHSGVGDVNPGTSHTVGTRLSVSSNFDTPDNYYTPGQVYPADVPSPLESPFKNGPPDSSHIHSPNMVDGSSLSSSASPAASHYDGGGFSHAYIESTHLPMSKPADTVYGTVDEVPLRGSQASTALTSPYDNLPQHHLHAAGPSPPPPPPPFPFQQEATIRAPGSTAAAAALALALHREQNYRSQAPPPSPPPSHAPSQHSHHHGDLDFTPSYQIKPSELPEAQQHLSESQSEISHGGPPVSSPPVETLNNLHHHPEDGPSSLPTDLSPPESSANLQSTTTGSDHQSSSVHGGQQSLDHSSSFPPHTHTMSVHADYEPANPPLPHDHPFHKGFIPFPTQEIHSPLGDAPPLGHDHHFHHHDTNSIANSSPYQPTPTGPTSNNIPYQPGPTGPTSPVEHHHQTKKPAPFEVSDSNSVKQHHGLEFTPIPDDVKDNDLFNSHYVQKPYDTPPPPHQPHLHLEAPEATHHLQPPMPTGSDHHESAHARHPSDPQLPSYLGPTGGGGESHYTNPNSGQSAAGGEEHRNELGYAGPVSEIHSGVYHPNQHQHHQHSAHHNLQDNLLNEQLAQHHDHLPGGGLIGSPGEEDYHKPSEVEKPQEAHGNNGEHSGKPSQVILPNGYGKNNNNNKGKRPFSKTPYVLMFPQLIPEEAMRPSPPSVLSKEIPVIQASSLADFTSGEKPPIGPGFQAVPVHPRHQMYQVLAKTHYDKMMEKYMESKKRPPSAIYTPYGILIPVGTNVAEAAAASSHNMFGKPRPPPKFRGEKSFLNALLGSPSSTNGRFHHPGVGLDGKAPPRLNKLLEYEPALDLLAEKLALKLVAAQQGGIGHHQGSLGSYSELKPVMVDSPDDKSIDGNKALSVKPWLQDQAPQESSKKPANPELKEYLKGVLKGHLTEMMESKTPMDDGRRPATLSSKLLSSFFRKGRLNIPPKSMMPMSSASMMPSMLGAQMSSNKVPLPPAPPGLPNALHHPSIGHSLPSHGPLPHGPVGLLGTIKRLFNFGPSERHDMGIGIGPNFAGRTLYIQNGTYMPYLDGPSPRSSPYAKLIATSQQSPPPPIMPAGMLKQQQQQPQYPLPPMQTQQAKLTTLPTAFNNLRTTSKPSKKKRKTKKPTDENSSVNKWQSNRLTSPSTSTTSGISTTAKPKHSSQHSNGTVYLRTKKTSNSNDNNSLSKGDSSTDLSSSSKKDSVLNKRIGATGGTSQDQQQPTKSSSSKLPTKLDMFQTLLGSTRSVLNYFKEGTRKTGPTVLKPRSAPTTTFIDSKFLRKRSTPTGSSSTASTS